MPSPMAQPASEVLAPDVVAEVANAQESPVSQVVITLPPSPPAPLAPDSSASSAILDDALTELGQLREDLQGTNSRLVAGRLELISSWVHSDASVRAALSQAAAASEEEKKATTQAAVARDAALKDTTVAQDRCKAMEAELQGLCDEVTK